MKAFTSAHSHIFRFLLTHKYCKENSSARSDRNMTETLSYLLCQVNLKAVAVLEDK